MRHCCDRTFTWTYSTAQWNLTYSFLSLHLRSVLSLLWNVWTRLLPIIEEARGRNRGSFEFAEKFPMRIQDCGQNMGKSLLWVRSRPKADEGSTGEIRGSVSRIVILVVPASKHKVC